MPISAIRFASEDSANAIVAGIPAVARALRSLGESCEPGAEVTGVTVGVPGGWSPSALALREAGRIARAVAWKAVDSDKIDGANWVSGAHCQQGIPGQAKITPPVATDDTLGDRTALRQAARDIVLATGKPGDGIVSRHINRPVSQAITSLVLHWSGARPWHATLAAGLIGIAMLAALLFGGERGLLAGAVLFQFASIVDGVDGEIARATFSSSARGAMMDSLTDAATNLGFLGGVSYNVYTGGHETAGLAGAAAVCILALGSALLARQSRRDGGNFTFDALKTRFASRPSRIRQWLTWIAMRDFYALASCVAILAGGANALLYAFLVVATGWFVVLCRTFVAKR